MNVFKLKEMMQSGIPDPIIKIVRYIFGYYRFKGNFSTWEEAKKASVGYNSDMILQKVKDASLKVRDGEAVYERDSVLFGNIQYSWPLLAGLLWISLQNENKLNLIDYGGAFGSSYYQNRKFLDNLKELTWNVVEQRKFVECGKQYFQDKHLKFFFSIDDCMFAEHPNAILFSAVIQYLEKPYDLIEEVIEKGFKYILFDRTPFLDHGNDRITVQVVHPKIYEASYPAWFFNLERFKDKLLEKYHMLAEFDALDKANIASKFKGFIFYRKETVL